jgi:ABC-type uncharacterized transport system permease subunit
VSFLLALVAAYLVWLLIWRTKLGYEMRTIRLQPRGGALCRHFGSADHHHRHADLGRIAGMMAINAIMGDQFTHQLDFGPAPASSASPSP